MPLDRLKLKQAQKLIQANKEVKLGLSYVFTFGKFKGETMESVFDESGGWKYIRWCLENISWFKVNKEVEDRMDDEEVNDSHEDWGPEPWGDD